MQLFRSSIFRVAATVAFLTFGQLSQASVGAMSAVNVRGFGAVGNGTTDDTAALNKAIAFAHNAGRSLYLPKGTYKINNATGPLTFNAFSGAVYGDGSTATSIVCTSTKNSCIHFQDPTNLDISKIAVSMAPVFAQCNADTTNCMNFRNNSRLINTERGTNINIHDVYLHDGSSAGLAIDGASGVTIQNVSARRIYGNGFYITDDTNVQASKLSTESSQDAGFEVTKWDSIGENPTPGPCSNITLTGYISFNDFGAVLVNGCQHVSISSFSVRHTWESAVGVRQDPATTKTQWPDDVTISNGVIQDVGAGNPPNSAVNAINLAARGTLGRNLQRVTIHDVSIDGGNSGSISVKVEADPTIVVNLANIKVTNAGGSCFDIAGGYVKASSLTCDTAPSTALTIRTPIEFTGSNFTVRNAPDSGRGDPNSIIVATRASGIVSLDGVDVTSSLSPAQVSFEDLDSVGRHKYNGIRLSVRDASKPSITLQNPAASISYQLNGGPQLKMGTQP